MPSVTYLITVDRLRFAVIRQEKHHKNPDRETEPPPARLVVEQWAAPESTP